MSVPAAYFAALPPNGIPLAGSIPGGRKSQAPTDIPGAEGERMPRFQQFENFQNNTRRPYTDPCGLITKRMKWECVLTTTRGIDAALPAIWSNGGEITGLTNGRSITIGSFLCQDTLRNQSSFAVTFSPANPNFENYLILLQDEAVGTYRLRLLGLNVASSDPIPPGLTFPFEVLEPLTVQ